MNCISCGAALSARSNLCSYCGAVNDTDLRAIQRSAETGSRTDRSCPRCSRDMGSIRLELAAETMHIERCDHCLGMFFDQGELETLIEDSVQHVYEVDHHKIRALVEEEGNLHTEQVSYVACPVCKKMMNRKAYGIRSGVIVDTCKGHGVWLDGGELGKILKWAKAGGREHTANRARSAKPTGGGSVKLPVSTAASAVELGDFSRGEGFEISSLVGLVGLLGRILR